MSVEDIVLQSRPEYSCGHVVWYLSPAVPARWLVCLNSDESVFKISHVLPDGSEREIFISEHWTSGRNAFVGSEAHARIEAMMARILAP